MEIIQAIKTHRSLYHQVDRRLRTLGLSWTALGREIGLSGARLKSILTGSRMDQDLYLRLCRALGWAPRAHQRRQWARQARSDRRRTFFPNLMHLFDPRTLSRNQVKSHVRSHHHRSLEAGAQTSAAEALTEQARRASAIHYL